MFKQNPCTIKMNVSFLTKKENIGNLIRIQKPNERSPKNAKKTNLKIWLKPTSDFTTEENWGIENCSWMYLRLGS